MLVAPYLRLTHAMSLSHCLTVVWEMMNPSQQLPLKLSEVLGQPLSPLLSWTAGHALPRPEATESTWSPKPSCSPFSLPLRWGRGKGRYTQPSSCSLDNMTAATATTSRARPNVTVAISSASCLLWHHIIFLLLPLCAVAPMSTHSFDVFIGTSCTFWANIPGATL